MTAANRSVNFALHTEAGLDVDSIFAPLQGSAARFAAAARNTRRHADSRPAAVEAARAFGDFLRVETMDFFRFRGADSSFRRRSRHRHSAAGRAGPPRHSA